MSIPPRKPPRASGGPAGVIRPDSWNAILDWMVWAESQIRQVQPQPSTDIGISRGQGGFVSYLKRRGGGSGGGGQRPPFACLGTVKDSSGGYTVTLQPGHLVERVPAVSDGGNAVIVHVPEIDGAAMTDKPAPPLEVTEDQVVYLKYLTDAKGTILTGEDPPQIVADEEGLQSTHHIPPTPDDDEGTEGEYYIPLFQFTLQPVSEEAGAEDRPVILPLVQSDVEHVPFLWSARDAEGDGASISPRYQPEDALWEFPKLAGKGEIKTEREGGTIEVTLDVTSTAHIRFFEVVIAVENATLGTVTVTQLSSSPYLELWIWKGLVYLSQPEDFIEEENPRDIFSAVPNVVP
jgi:hypothetical protein